MPVMSKRTNAVVTVDFAAHRHVAKTMREILGPSASVANDFRLTSPEAAPEDDGMLPGMAEWKRNYTARRP